jgi:hypothetical protein
MSAPVLQGYMHSLKASEADICACDPTSTRLQLVMPIHLIAMRNNGPLIHYDPDSQTCKELVDVDSAIFRRQLCIRKDYGKKRDTRGKL